MHAYLPQQEKMTEMVHSPISTLFYFVDHANLITIWSALLLECKVMITSILLFFVSDISDNSSPFKGYGRQQQG
jgi:hypothetical protein